MNEYRLFTYQYLVGCNLLGCYLLDIFASEAFGTTVPLIIYVILGVLTAAVLLRIEGWPATWRWHIAAGTLLAMTSLIYATPWTPRKAFMQSLARIEVGDTIEGVDLAMSNYRNRVEPEQRMVPAKIARYKIRRVVSAAVVERYLSEKGTEWVQVDEYHTGPGRGDYALIYIANEHVVHIEFEPALLD